MWKDFRAFIARGNPLAVIPVALILGGIGASGGLLQRIFDLPDQPIEIAVIAGHRRADIRVLGEQLEQFEPGEIDVVVLARGHEMGVDPPAGWTVGHHVTP